ncbi:MAG: hypothetical protein Q7R64_00260 [bacterium]|nr:hypothetical protein [bacterium]
MKICLQLQRQFAYTGHAMAINLKERYGVTDFCAYVELTPSLDFLRAQKEISYSAFLMEADLHNSYKNEPLDLVYLAKLEQDYGLPNLWPYIEIDRTVRYGLGLREYPYHTPLLSHEEMMRTLTGSARKIIAFLDTERPDVIIFSVITDVSCFLLYHIAKKRGIKTLFIVSERIGVNYTLTEDYHGLTFVQDVYEKLQKKTFVLTEEASRAEAILRAFRENPAPYTAYDTLKERPVNRGRQFRFLLPRHIGKSIYWLVRNTRDYFRYQSRDYIKNPFYILLDRTKRKMRVLLGFQRFYDTFNPKEEFVFYPLQLEPEMSIALFAPFWSDQLSLCKQIARSLPMSMTLYVKEHPGMWGYRPRSYYQELKKIPNLKLLPPSVVNFDILKHAKLVVTLTGTSGWEALLMQKPVITFGDTFYNILPTVKKCTAITNLPSLIKEQLERSSSDEVSLIHLITALLKEGAPLDLVQLWLKEGSTEMEKKKKEVAVFVDYLAGKLHLTPKLS